MTAAEIVNSSYSADNLLRILNKIMTMKNKFAIVLVVLMMLAVLLGCSYSFDSKSSSEKPKTDAPSTQDGNSNSGDSAKTGVKECDEFLDLISEDSKSPDENFVTRKLREAATDYFKEEVRKNIDENKGDKEKIASTCRELRDNYAKDKAKKDSENKDAK